MIEEFNMTIFNADEFGNRIQNLKSLLVKRGIDAAIFNQSPDLYYYTGSVLPLYCVIPSNGEPFVLARKSSARIESDVTHMKFEYFTGSKDLKKIWADYSLAEAKKIAFTLESSSYASVSRMRDLSSDAAIEDISNDVRALRMTKSEAEIAIQTRAGKNASYMTDIIREKLRPGITELEMSAHIEHAFRLSGNGVIASKQEGLVMSSGVCSAGLNTLAGNKFDGICSGTGVSPALPFGASFDAIPLNTPVLFDFGYVLDGYHADITRMASIGNPSEKVLDAYRAMREIEKAVVERLKPGNTWESIYDLALIMAAEKGYREEFMGLGKEKVRFVGHGVGIQLDEPPFLAAKMPQLLAAGMVVAIEPKVSFPDIGVVGIENTYVIRKDGAELITTAPEDFIII